MLDRNPGDSALGSEIWVYSFADRQARPLVTVSGDAHDGHISPDGHWIAYESNETGSTEVYVRSFPNPGPATRVPTSGGHVPTWRHDGSALLYTSPDGRVMSVATHTGARFDAGAPSAMTPPLVDGRSAKGIVLPRDGRIGIYVQGEIAPLLAVFTNWPARVGDRTAH